MTMTVALLRELEPSRPVLAVVPSDAFPHGAWSGSAKRTLSGFAARDAVPARLLRVEQRQVPDGGSKRTVAVVAYEAPATGEDAFLPGAILGAWADLQARREADRNYPDLMARASHAAHAFGAGVNPAAKDGVPMVLLTVAAAERIAVYARVARDELEAGRPNAARAAIDEILDPEGRLS